MKAKLIEHGACFEIVLEPETTQEQAAIIRFGMNSTKDLRSLSANVYQDLTVSGYVILGKRKQATSAVAPG